VAASDPACSDRISRLLQVAEAAGASLHDHTAVGIHRDFYPAQILVDGPRLYLLDLDLYCAGDPALDVGNFMAHLAEQALREQGDPAALAHVETALSTSYLSRAGTRVERAVSAYRFLSLLRHIWISTKVPGRSRTTIQLIEICELEAAGICRMIA
jgi:hypothetical protein